MSQRTEKAIASALKTLLAKKPLNKITISDIANECGINRMTFYYHFRDIYDLIEWICDEDFDKALEGCRTLSGWQEGVLKLMVSMQDDKAFFTGVYNSLEKGRIENYINRVISQLLEEGVRQIPSKAGVTQEELQFAIDFYAYAFCGHLTHWLADGMKDDPAVIVDRLGKVGKNGLSRAMDAFAEDKT